MRKYHIRLFSRLRRAVATWDIVEDSSDKSSSSVIDSRMLPLDGVGAVRYFFNIFCRFFNFLLFWVYFICWICIWITILLLAPAFWDLSTVALFQFYPARFGQVDSVIQPFYLDSDSPEYVPIPPCNYQTSFCTCKLQIWAARSVSSTFLGSFRHFFAALTLASNSCFLLWLKLSLHEV